MSGTEADDGSVRDPGVVRWWQIARLSTNLHYKTVWFFCRMMAFGPRSARRPYIGERLQRRTYQYACVLSCRDPSAWTMPRGRRQAHICVRWSPIWGIWARGSRRLPERWPDGGRTLRIRAKFFIFMLFTRYVFWIIAVLLWYLRRSVAVKLLTKFLVVQSTNWHARRLMYRLSINETTVTIETTVMKATNEATVTNEMMVNETYSWDGDKWDRWAQWDWWDEWDEWNRWAQWDQLVYKSYKTWKRT